MNAGCQITPRRSPPRRLGRSRTAQSRAAPSRSEPPSKNAAPRRRGVHLGSSPLSSMALLKRSRADPARALFEPDPTSLKPKRRRASKARDVSDDLELGPRRRPRQILERGPRVTRAARVAPRVGGVAPHGIWPAAARGRSAFEPFKKLTLVTPRPISVTPSNSPSRRSPLKRRKRDDTVSATRSNLDSESGVCHCRKFVCKVCKSRPRARSVDTFY